MTVVLARNLVGVAAATGAVAAGVALFEAALVPGMVIGAAVVLVPQFLSRDRLGKKRGFGADDPHQHGTRSRESLRNILRKSLGDLTHIRISQTVVKTVTFRVIVTSLDFTANYLILGEPTTAAGLSAISLVGGPLFYFLHEGSWNYLVGSGKLRLEAQGGGPKFLGNRPLVKTITYRTLATLIEFTTNYIVVRDVGTAALLSSFGFFLGPFVYYGHELAWERYGSKNAGEGNAGRRRAGKRPPVIIDVEPEPMASPS